MPADRYFVDERGGCIAVRDRTLTDPEDPGLHGDTTGVVGYWHGQPLKRTCPTCRHTMSAGWILPQEAKDEAKALCKRLNADEEHPHA